MKVIPNILFVKILFCLCMISCASLPESQRNKEFIILKTKDTIVADQLRSVNPFRNMGRVTITNMEDGQEVETMYTYDQIYQIHEFDRKNRPNVVEIIEETPSRIDTHVGMDIVINEGKVKLYLNDPGFRPDYYFVVSDFYHGYANKYYKRKKLLVHLNKCEAFHKKFTEKEQRKKKNLEKMIRYYNKNCDY
ncbi:hypothetical protein U8527_19075 [Kordia algicida OT-1]|uniref:Lipoprotein n=1 Tax=Kordia algicida OT-1 TaxID=391587 RepID=A9DJI5_9FLAO|nr:hypothetical protein [Kordia algicida]EDP98109.1 hypothetical protein KAOT1_12867 [Kordia algicida OT-1]